MKRKNENGITLIALVVTIIILLILAGVTVGMATSGTGLFEKAKEATEKYQNKQVEEEMQIAKYNNEIESYINGNSREISAPMQIDLSTIDSSAKGQITINNNVVTINGYVTKSVASGAAIITLPSNLCPSSEKYCAGTYTGGVDNGLSADKFVLNTSGQIINPSGGTRTQFTFFVTYIID